MSGMSNTRGMSVRGPDRFASFVQVVRRTRRWTTAPLIGLGLAVAGAALGVMAQAAPGQVSFRGPTNFPAGAGPRSVAVGDFNGDSRPDLAVANASGAVSVLLNDGTGGFSAPTSMFSGNGPFSVAVGDFNGDSRLDLAVANSNTTALTAGISVLLGDGTGRFGAPINFRAGDGPVSVAVGDFDGDLDLDLAVANSNSDNVSVLLGDGRGLFSGPANFAAGNGPASVAVGDFNSDLDLDLVVANNRSNTVTVLLGDGTGGFGAPANFAVGAFPVSVAVGDFDGDFNLDLAVANISGSLSVLLNDGTGGFGAPANYVADDGPRSVVVGDFNSDSAFDLAAANLDSDNLSVLLGDGTGRFGAQTRFAAGNAPWSVAVGDLDGDSDLDLAVASAAGVSVLWNNRAPSAADNTYTITEDTALRVAAPGVLANDHDPDGDLLSAVLGSGPAHGTLTLNADNSFTYMPAAGFSGIDSFTYQATDGTLGSNPATVTITVTALPPSPVDLAVAKTDGQTTYVPGAPTRYSITVTNAGPSTATGFSVADHVPATITGVTVACAVTGTGSCGTNGSAGNRVSVTDASLAPGPGHSLTLIVSGLISPSASGPLVNTATVAAGARSTDVNPGNNTASDTTTTRPGCDVNGDGTPDLLTGAGPGGAPHVRVFSVRAGRLTALAGFLAYSPDFGGGVTVACGDVTGDGVADIITGAGAGGGPHVRAFSLAGGGVTDVASFFAYDPAFLGGVSVAAADVTGDGVADIITGAGPGGGPHVRAFSLAGGGVTDVASFFAYDPAFGGGVSVAAADVTGDGVADIITGAGPGGGPHVRAFSLAGGGVTDVAGFFAYDPAFLGGVSVAAADVTGDGVADIITGAGPGGGPHVRAFSVTSGSPAELASFFAYDPAFGGGVVVAGKDVTGDGVAEIITGAGPGGGPHVRVLEVRGGSVWEWASFFAYDPAFTGGVCVR